MLSGDVIQRIAKLERESKQASGTGDEENGGGGVFCDRLEDWKDKSTASQAAGTE